MSAEYQPEISLPEASPRISPRLYTTNDLGYSRYTNIPFGQHTQTHSKLRCDDRLNAGFKLLGGWGD